MYLWPTKLSFATLKSRTSLIGFGNFSLFSTLPLSLCQGHLQKEIANWFVAESLEATPGLEIVFCLFLFLLCLLKGMEKRRKLNFFHSHKFHHQKDFLNFFLIAARSVERDFSSPFWILPPREAKKFPPWLSPRQMPPSKGGEEKEISVVLENGFCHFFSFFRFPSVDSL